jgi:hypothetical protein
MTRRRTDDTTITRTGLVISRLERLTNSPGTGSPRWLVHFTDGTSADTFPDAEIAFGIENSEYRHTPLTVACSSRTGQVTRIERETARCGVPGNHVPHGAGQHRCDGYPPHPRR